MSDVVSAPGTASPTIWTIGHSAHAPEVLLDLLASARIEAVVDVRSQPFSRFAPQFCQAPLRERLAGAQIKYLFLGGALGGRPEGEDYYDEQGHVLYGEIAATDWFTRGIERVLDGAKQFRVALLCAEEDPESCHRRLLVSRVLEQRGAQVQHIRGDGRVQTEADLSPEPAQESLFESVQEVTWRSTRSVSPRRAQSSSLAS